MGADEFDGAFLDSKAANRPSRRRAAALAHESSQAVDGDFTDDAPNQPPLQKPAAGWGAESTENQNNIFRRARKKELTKQQDSGQKIYNTNDDDDGITTFIPDLENEEEDFAKQVACAPELLSGRVQSIDELDQEVDVSIQSRHEIGVDLGVLNTFISPPKHLVEDDERWDMERELQSIASEMARETTFRSNSVANPKKI